MKRTIVFVIAAIGGLCAHATEWRAREMTVDKVERGINGRVKAAELSFGASNGLENRLYVAYGDVDGGDRIENWQKWKLLGMIGDDVDTFRTKVPSARYCRFFLDVPFGDAGAFGVPVKWVTGDGSAYADIGLKIRNDDVLTVVFRRDKNCNEGGIMGTRNKLNLENANAVLSAGNGIMIDYSSNPADGNNYSKYRLKGVTPTYEAFYEIEMGAARRRVYSITGGAQVGLNDVSCPDVFTTTYNCYLFKVSGAPSITTCAAGQISSFTIKRGSDFVSDCIPFRVGGEYGFVDRMQGRFIKATEGAFGGEEDASLVSQFTSQSETFDNDGFSGLEEDIVPRTVEIVDCSDCVAKLQFGKDNGVDNRLFVAYGAEDGGLTLAGWDNVADLGIIGSEDSTFEYELPATACKFRFFLFLPFEGDKPPVQLKQVSGDGTGYFDTCQNVKNGDAISIRARIDPKSHTDSQIFGCRSSSNANDANVVILTSFSAMVNIDYTGGAVSTHRMISSSIAAYTKDVWFEFYASSDKRQADIVGDRTIGLNETACTKDFETAYTCWLFAQSGYEVVPNKLIGDIAYLKIRRTGRQLVEWQPCRMDSECGFLDLVTGDFHQAAEGTFSGEDDTTLDKLAAVSGLGRPKQGMLVIIK